MDSLSMWLNQLNTTFVLSTIVSTILNFIPRLLVAIVLFIIGRVIANSIARTITKILVALNLKQVVSSFQVGLEIKKDTETGIIHAISMIGRYVVLYGVLIVILQVVGLTSVANFFIHLTDIAPKLLSSLLILAIGIVAAGFIETVIKRTIITVDPITARLSGKIASYVVVSFFLLMSLAELGLAATFVNTLFIGLVATVVISVGLAIGLGSKDLVREVLLRWYSKRQQ